MRRIVTSVFLLATFEALVSGPVFAAGCDNVARDDELRDCLSKELATADKELNATYAKLRAAMNKEPVELLTKAQKLWISLRDADCDLEAEAYKGGSAYQAVYLQCRINKTMQRTSEFKKSTYWPRK
jgi:uncharacterized protein YecT (DUF1311 family)